MLLIAERTHASLNWYQRLFKNEFDATRTMFLVFSDNVPRATKFMDLFKKNLTLKLQFTIVDEPNYAAAMHAISLCKHHVLSSSTFSFWCTYNFSFSLISC